MGLAGVSAASGFGFKGLAVLPFQTSPFNQEIEGPEEQALRKQVLEDSWGFRVLCWTTQTGRLRLQGVTLIGVWRPSKPSKELEALWSFARIKPVYMQNIFKVYKFPGTAID